LKGWHGYVEWEKYPERKAAVKAFLKEFDFPGVSFFLLSVDLFFLELGEMR